MRTPRVRTRSKLLALIAAASILATFSAVSVLAVHDDGLFELDKDAGDGTVSVMGGWLASTVSDTATSINVCRPTSPSTTLAEDGETLRIRQETMVVTDVTDPGTFNGNCGQGNSKVTYAVDRSGAPANTQQKGGGDVTAQISIIRPATLTGTDWDAVYTALNDNDPDTTCQDLGLTACTFLFDDIGPSIYTIGSTKDHLPISGWHHTDGGSPDKGEIINAYAAKGISADDHEILYFGMDRWAVDGSTDIGFWFFQDEVFACPDPDAGDLCDGVPDGQFAGEHVEGDILLLGTFTQGGATSNIRVFTWVDTGGDPGNVSGPSDTFGDCVPGSGGDEGCATVNNTTIGVPWTYTFKGAATGQWIPAGGFFEGGIDLTANDLEGCFPSFLAETRSSPEVTAILKDFALGQFEECEATVTTTPSDGDTEAPSGPAPLEDTNDNDIPDVQLGIGDAGANVTDAATVVVNGTSDWQGDFDWFLCGPIPTTELCDGIDNVGVPMGSEENMTEETVQPIFSDVANLTEVGYYCWRGEFTSETQGLDDAEDATIGECFEVLPVTPVLTTTSVDAEGNAFSGPVPFGDNVYDKGTLTGTANEPGDNGPSSEFPSINSTNGLEADGTITFTLKVDAGNSCGANAGGEPAANNPEEIAVEGDGDYFTTGFAPDTPGVYAWVASYDGSTSGNTLGDDHNTDCTDAAENYTVQQLTPVVATEQIWRPQDEATITVAPGGGALNGTIDFELFDNEDCTGTALYDEFDVAITVDVGGLSATAATSNTEFDVSTSTQVWWKVTYDSDNQAHTDAFSICVEDTSLTIDNTTAPSP